MARLDDLPSTHVHRILQAHDPSAWQAHCAPSHVSPWLAWNAREDAWYRPQDLLRIQDAIDRANPALVGPELLIWCAPSLQNLRDLSAAEQTHLPGLGINHVSEGRLRANYDLAPSSDWDDGGLSGETNPPPFAVGLKIRIRAKPARTRKWLTFDSRVKVVPRYADVVARFLGLPWGPVDKLLIRVEIPLGQLQRAGASFFVPTIFDGMGAWSALICPDWRARPASEHRADEPWGRARDMLDDGPGLPEVLVDITNAGEMDAECLGTLRQDWSSRPYLLKGGPR